MHLKDSGYQVRNPKWDSIISGILPDTYVANSQDLLWAVDAHRRLIFANDAYLDFMLKATGAEAQLDDYAFSPDGNKAMSDKWDYFYGRALNGEHFHIITNFASSQSAMLVDANFIPLVSEGHILGTACLARATSSMVLPVTDSHKEEKDNTSFHSNS